MATKKQRVVFYVDGEIKEKLNELAKKEHRSLSNWLENLALNKIESQQLKKVNSKDPIAA